METAILNILKEKNTKSGGHCGIYIPHLLLKLNIKYNDIKGTLNSLYKQKLITTREGSQGKLIFYKQHKNAY